MSMEHICYVSGDGLPDVRVEREFYSLGRSGFQLSFLGKVSRTNNIFEAAGVKVNLVNYDIGLNRYVNLRIEPYYTWAKRRIGRALRRIRPDIVVAVNIVAGAIVHELGYPMVLDDHEVYSKKALYSPATGVDKLIRARKLKLFLKYERMVAEHHPVIVVSEYGQAYYRGLGARAYLVKNWPVAAEVRDLKFRRLPCRPLRVAVITRDISPRRVSYNRDIRLAWKLLQVYVRHGLVHAVVIGDRGVKSSRNIESLGYIPHNDIYGVLQNCHAGLLALAPTPHHAFCGSNRAYMYMHVGCIPIVTASLESVLIDLGDYEFAVDTWQFAKSLADILKKLLDLDCNELNSVREGILNLARRRLVWDLQSNVLVDAVKAV